MLRNHGNRKDQEASRIASRPSPPHCVVCINFPLFHWDPPSRIPESHPAPRIPRSISHWFSMFRKWQSLRRACLSRLDTSEAYGQLLGRKSSFWVFDIFLWLSHSLGKNVVEVKLPFFLYRVKGLVMSVQSYSDPASPQLGKVGASSRSWEVSAFPLELEKQHILKVFLGCCSLTRECSRGLCGRRASDGEDSAAAPSGLYLTALPFSQHLHLLLFLFVIVLHLSSSSSSPFFSFSPFNTI